MWEKLKAKLSGALKSFTVWSNTAALAALAVLPELKEDLGELQQYISADAYRFAGMVLVVVNIALRFKTNKNLSEK